MFFAVPLDSPQQFNDNHHPIPMTPPDPESESDRWLSISQKLLSASDLIGSKRFAERALESNPLHPSSLPDQLIAISDILLASQKRLNNHHLDWYSILNLPSSSPPSSIHSSFRRLSRLLTNTNLPFAHHASTLLSDAYSVLSDPTKKSLFDSEIKVSPHFWTRCASCCHLFKYERSYKLKHLKCQNCGKPFVAEELETEPLVVPGTDTYYCTWGYFPMGYPGGPQFGMECTKEEEVRRKVAAKKRVGRSTGGLKESSLGIDINEVIAGVDVQIL